MHLVLLSRSQSITLSQKNLPHLDKGNYAAWLPSRQKNSYRQFNVDTKERLLI